ncbi:MAG: CYTH domain-containing protein [Psychroserpens sp.]|uniref:CYTH domain-containing protein n=1 Tax=Psychroserpens sp. TaxID=2020870 RepID=UPI003C7136B3
MIEIERKFLVTSEAFKTESFKHTRIIQGYLNADPHRAVRVRLQGTEGFLTIKGISNESGLSRFEWETKISGSDAKALLQLCEKGVIEKVRFEVKLAQHIIEVDEFYQENIGLVLAEVELKHEDEHFEKPSWLGQEVTGDQRYYNSQLSQYPFKDWT